MKRYLALAVLVLALGVAGCSVLSGSVSGPGDPSRNEAIAIHVAGDLGAVGCAVAAIQAEDQPEQLVKVKAGVSAARLVLQDADPTITELANALDVTGVPPEYTRISAVLITRVKARLGQAESLPTDSVAFAMTRAFVDACDLALPGDMPAVLGAG